MERALLLLMECLWWYASFFFFMLSFTCYRFDWLLLIWKFRSMGCLPAAEDCTPPYVFRCGSIEFDRSWCPPDAGRKLPLLE